MKIFLIGFMGAGKTYWAKKISQSLKIPFFDLDEKIVEHAGKSISELFEIRREEGFRLLEKEVLYLLTESHETFVMSCGGGTPCYFNNIDYLKKNGTVVWINSSPENLYSRLLKEKDTRPLLMNISDEDLKSFIVKKSASRKIFYEQANVIASEDELTIDELIRKIFHPNF
jgi:shikimate kinase